MTTPAADAGLSNWWPTPVCPTDHFAADELTRSAALHRPVRRVRRELAMARFALLAAAGVVIGIGPLRDPLAGSGSSVRSLVGAAAVVLAVRVPEAVAAWRLRRLDAVEPVDPSSGGPQDAGRATGSGRVDVPPGAGAVVGSVLAVVALALIARFLLGPLTRPATGWMLAMAMAVGAAIATLIGTTVRAGRSDEVTVPQSWADLLHRAGLGSDVEIGVLDQPGTGGVGSPNACALGIAGRRWILVDPSLLAHDAEDAASGVPGPIGDFILAHEATHLARRHPEAQLAINAGTLGAALGVIPLLAGTGWPWHALGFEPDDPAALPVAVLVVLVAAAALRLPVAWVLRGLERSADAGAVELIGTPDRGAMRVLHLTAGGELAPPWWSRLAAVRPSPAERLEYLARCRRPAQGAGSATAGSRSSSGAADTVG